MNKLYKNLFLLGLTIVAQNLNAQTDILTDENVTVVNEKTVNTEKLDFSPTFYEDGIVFISSDNGKAKSKIFDENISRQAMTIKIAKRGADGILEKPEIFAPELTSPFHEGPLTFDKVAEEVFFSRNNFENGKLILVKDKETGKDRALQQIYTATKVGNAWKNITKLGFNISEYAFRHPTLSLDGKKLYFSSNRPGGLGGYDIWVANRNGDTWSEPINLGAPINTAQNEAFPFIHADGTLFFASDTKGGIGGLDMYYAKMNGKNFENVTNLGKPFNSAGDDFGLILDLDRRNGYFTSNRVGSKGEDDIYSFTSTEKVPANPAMAAKAGTVLCVKAAADQSLIEDATAKYVNITDFDISSISTDKSGSINKLEANDNTNILQLVEAQPLKVLTTDATCHAPFMVADGDYLVNVTKEGYAPKQVILKARADKKEYVVLLDKLKAGKPMVGQVINDAGQPIPNAQVTITDNENGTPQVVMSDPEGNFDYVALPNKVYTSTVRKPNLPTTSMKLDPTMPLKIQIREQTTTPAPAPFREGQVFELTNVYYNYNDATLRPDALRDINALLKVMQTYPELEIELSSHTDCRGTTEYNQNLSQRRAESVVRYLVKNGVRANRMVAVGYGENKLRNECADGATCTEEEHQRNRRTEVKITKVPSNASVSVVDKMPEFTDPKPDSYIVDEKSNVISRGGKPVQTGGATKVRYQNTKTETETSTTTDVQTQSVATSENNTNGFDVVVGTFGNKNNADILKQKMLSMNYVNTKIVMLKGKSLYRVIAENYPTQNDAEGLVTALKSQGFGDSFFSKN